MSVVLFDKFGPWTIDDLRSLPESSARIELDEGSLVVTPAPAPRHQVAVARLRDALSVQLGEGFDVFENLGVDLATSMRIPDLLVIRSEDIRAAPNELDPTTLILVVEVVSPSSQSQDRLVKPTQYAQAGIPAFWRVETEGGIALAAYVLRDGVYAEVGSWSAGEMVEITEPFAFSMDVDRLVLDG